MSQNHPMRRFTCSLAVVAAGSTPAWANNCEALRSAIETKIRANGVANPQLSVVPMDAEGAGRVVGSCAKGTMKILYSAPPNAAPKAPPVLITECADGRVITSGSCKQR